MEREPAAVLVLPRGLILLASMWLVISWMAAIGFRTPVEASSSSYTPGVRIMLISAALGLMVAWPLMRLTQPKSHFPLRETLLDLVVLLALLQVVIWPLRLVTPWSQLRTAALDATLVSWTVLAGALVASAIGSSRQGPRTLAMAGCVGVCLIGPALALLTLAAPPLQGLAAHLERLGPLMEVFVLSQGGGTPPDPAQWRWIGLVALAGLLAWSGLAATRRRETNTRY